MATVTKPESLETRVADLERTVAELRRQIELPKKQRWIDKIIGSMRDEPDFDQVVKFGREWRQSQASQEGDAP